MDRFFNIPKSTLCLLMLAALPALGQEIKINESIKGSKTTETKTYTVDLSRKKEKTPQGLPAGNANVYVEGAFETSREKAKNSAILAASEEVLNYMKANGHDLNRGPSIELVRKMMVANQKTDDKEPDGSKEQDGIRYKEVQLSSDSKEIMYRATIALEVKPEHVRTLRSRDRGAESMWAVGGLALLLGAVALFFKFDAWTKGYFTNWLFIVLVVVGFMILGSLIMTVATNSVSVIYF